MLLKEVFQKEKTKWTARKVCIDILGDLAWFGDEEDAPIGKIVICPTWDHAGRTMFSNFDMKPEEGGAIGLQNVNGRSIADIAEAAHESFHALLHSRNKNLYNEHLVNRLALAWLKKNLDEVDFQKATETIMKSKLAYQKQKYVSTRTWNKTGKFKK